MAAAWEALAREARGELGVEITPAALESLRSFVSELLAWSESANLVSAGSLDEVVFRHVLDSLAPLRFLPAAGVTADVGSGAGFPGVPLAILHGGPFLLVESRRRRSSFLRHVVRRLGLSGVEVFEGRAEDLDRALAAVLSRAVRPEVAIAVAHRLLGAGGKLLLLEKHDAPVPAAEGFAALAPFAYRLPDGARHRVTVLERRFT